VTHRAGSCCQLCYKSLVGLITFLRTAKYSKVYGWQSVFLKDVHKIIFLGTETVFMFL